jgi:hypothetical protein
MFMITLQDSGSGNNSFGRSRSRGSPSVTAVTVVSTGCGCCMRPRQPFNRTLELQTLNIVILHTSLRNVQQHTL